MSPPITIDCRTCAGDGVISHSWTEYFEGTGTTCPTCLGSTIEEIDAPPRTLADLEQEDFDMLEASLCR